MITKIEHFVTQDGSTFTQSEVAEQHDYVLTAFGVWAQANFHELKALLEKEGDGKIGTQPAAQLWLSAKQTLEKAAEEWDRQPKLALKATAERDWFESVQRR